MSCFWFCIELYWSEYHQSSTTPNTYITFHSSLKIWVLSFKFKIWHVVHLCHRCALCIMKPFKYWGPYHSQFSIIIQIWWEFHFDSTLNSTSLISAKFCTGHESCAVKACEKLSGLRQNYTKLIFHRPKLPHPPTPPPPHPLHPTQPRPSRTPPPPPCPIPLHPTPPCYTTPHSPPSYPTSSHSPYPSLSPPMPSGANPSIPLS